jgi:hypothetical protein
VHGASERSLYSVSVRIKQNASRPGVRVRCNISDDLAVTAANQAVDAAFVLCFEILQKRRGNHGLAYDLSKGLDIEFHFAHRPKEVLTGASVGLPCFVALCCVLLQIPVPPYDAFAGEVRVNDDDDDDDDDAADDDDAMFSLTKCMAPVFPELGPTYAELARYMPI